MDGTWIRGTVGTILTRAATCADACQTYLVVYDIEKFFVPEGTGHELEQLRNGQHLAVDVAVGADGRAALKRLLVDGAPRYEVPLL